MNNERMMEKLKTGEAIDVGAIGEKVPSHTGHVWMIHNYMEGVDYCDAESEIWIWSIGKNKQDGKYYAASDARFYGNPLFDCVWLR